MTTKAVTHPNMNFFLLPDDQAKEIGRLGLSAAAGALLGCALSLINPIGGAVFCATAALTSSLVNKCVEKLKLSDDPTTQKVAAWAAVTICSMAIGALVASALGFPLSVAAAIGMTAAMQLSTIAMQWAYSK